MTDIKYSFFDQPFDVSTANLKTQPTTNAKYVELVYPRDNNKPVLSYNNLMFYPSRLVIARSSSPTVDYVLYMETVNSSNANKLFINMMLKRDASKPDGDLTKLFEQIKINTATANPAIVNLNSLFGSPSVKHKINKSSTSEDLTLNINDVITTKIDDVTLILTGSFSVTETFPTLTTTQNTSSKDVLLIYSHLTQRQRCTRSTDNASKTVPVVTATTSSVQTNILVLVILGLCVAAFFPSIYYGLVCLPAGGVTNHAKIHLIYLIGALSMVIPLFVRGFRDGDPAAQVWGIGIIVLVLIFGWQYVDLSRKLILKCGGNNVVLSDTSIFSHLSAGVENNKLFLFVFIVSLFILWVSALAMSPNGEVFSGLLAGQAIITVIAIFLNKYYK